MTTPTTPAPRRSDGARPPVPLQVGERAAAPVEPVPARGPASAPAPGSARRPAVPPPPVLDLVVPVHDEQVDLEPCVRRLEAHLSRSFPWTYRITVVDNASRDRTLAVARSLERDLPCVRVLHLDEKGRGRALHTAWLASDAAVLAYTDVDLSTDLAALLPLVAPLVAGHSELAIGSRLSRTSRVVRGPRREVVSRCYNLLLRGALGTRFSDAQCGFKAVRRDVALSLLPLVEDTGWFFDTELLVLAERADLRIHEVPVDWVDDPDSRVDLVPTAVEDLRGIARLGRALVRGDLPLGAVRDQLGRSPLPASSAVTSLGAPAGLLGQLVRFGVVGALSTVAYVLIYALARAALPAQAANLLALLVTAVANTAANRRVTFGVRGRASAARHHLQGLAVFALAWALTAGSLGLLHAMQPVPSRWLEIAVLVGANLLATLLRFLLLRSWVFRAQEQHEDATPAVPTAAVTPVAPTSETSR